MTEANGPEATLQESHQQEGEYPSGDHLRLITWREFREWDTPYDTLTGEMERVGDGEAMPGEPCFLYGAVERKLQDRLGEEHWELDSQGRAGIVVKADRGYRFTADLRLVNEATGEITGGDPGQGE